MYSVDNFENLEYLKLSEAWDITSNAIYSENLTHLELGCCGSFLLNIIYANLSSKLEYIDLDGYLYSQNVDLSHMDNLEYINIPGSSHGGPNHGDLPSLEHLSNLTYANFEDNAFTGNIPEHYCNYYDEEQKLQHKFQSHRLEYARLLAPKIKLLRIYNLFFLQK